MGSGEGVGKAQGGVKGVHKERESIKQVKIEEKFCPPILRVFLVNLDGLVKEVASIRGGQRGRVKGGCHRSKNALRGIGYLMLGREKVLNGEESGFNLSLEETIVSGRKGAEAKVDGYEDGSGEEVGLHREGGWSDEG
jgi:hypothetical protein